MKRTINWDARCRSGYQYATMDGRKRVVFRTCSRNTARGRLLCDDCMDAVSVATPQRRRRVALDLIMAVGLGLASSLLIMGVR